MGYQHILRPKGACQGVCKYGNAEAWYAVLWGWQRRGGMSHGVWQWPPPRPSPVPLPLRHCSARLYWYKLVSMCTHNSPAHLIHIQPLHKISAAIHTHERRHQPALHCRAA